MNTYIMTDLNRERVVRNYTWAVDHGIVFNGLPASDDIVSINGCHIMFFIHKDTSKDAVRFAMVQAKRQRDVVGFSCMIIPKGFPNDIT